MPNNDQPVIQIEIRLNPLLEILSTTLCLSKFVGLLEDVSWWWCLSPVLADAGICTIKLVLIFLYLKINHYKRMK